MQRQPNNLLAFVIQTGTRTMLPLLAFVIVSLVATELFACPTCKDGIAENDPASAAQAAGYFYSILFMMAMPFLILGTLGSAAYFSIRKARERQAGSRSLDSTALASGHSSS